MARATDGQPQAQFRFFWAFLVPNLRDGHDDQPRPWRKPFLVFFGWYRANLFRARLKLGNCLIGLFSGQIKRFFGQPNAHKKCPKPWFDISGSGPFLICQAKQLIRPLEGHKIKFTVLWSCVMLNVTCIKVSFTYNQPRLCQQPFQLVSNYPHPVKWDTLFRANLIILLLQVLVATKNYASWHNST